MKGGSLGALQLKVERLSCALEYEKRQVAKFKIVSAERDRLQQALRDETDRAKEYAQENARLKRENKTLQDHKIENKQLKKRLKNTDAQNLEKQLHQARSELDGIRVILKKIGMPNQDSRVPSDDDDELSPCKSQSSAPKTRSIDRGHSFPDAAVELLKEQKLTLRELRELVAGMKDIRGGDGWGIVERTESMVTAKSLEMI